MSDNLLLDIIARSIGRTITQENYRQRAADVLRSVKENDLTLPQPTNLIEHEITRLRAENEKLQEALIRIDGMATTICMKDDAGYGVRAESVMPIYEAARAALEGVMEPATGDSNA